MMKANLYYKDEVSDKVYQVEMKEEGEGYIVNISYGRSGSNLQKGTKTTTPVSKEEAQKIFDKLVKAKVAKGYVLLDEVSLGGEEVRKASFATAFSGTVKSFSPMLCQKVTVDQAKELLEIGDEWVVEQKFDGVRATIRGGKLYNRAGSEITNQFPEFEGIETLKMGYDGEIIAQSGEFNDISGRVHLKDKFLIKLQAKKSPAKLMIFDVLERGNKSLKERRKILEQTDFSSYKWIELTDQVPATDFEKMWSIVQENKLEGLVIKRTSAPYQEGRRSPDWLKVKAWVEVVAEFTKYEDHPRGITIETADGRRVVVNGVQAIKVKQLIEQNGSINAEIQHLPQKDSGAWRFPSFRGVMK